MEKIVASGLLYDFYGELLTAHQKEIFEDFVYHDLSLAEIAAEHGISRQGAHDVIRRCGATLQKYEDKLGLVGRFLRMKEMVEELQQLTGGEIGDVDTLTERVNEVTEGILRELL